MKEQPENYRRFLTSLDDEKREELREIEARIYEGYYPNKFTPESVNVDGKDERCFSFPFHGLKLFYKRIGKNKFKFRGPCKKDSKGCLSFDLSWKNWPKKSGLSGLT